MTSAHVEFGARVAERSRAISEEAWRTWGGLDRCASWHPPRVTPGGARAVVVSPHPDDEVFGIGGTMQILAAAGWDLDLIHVTDGEASHPSWPGGPSALAETRQAEMAAAIDALGIEFRVTQRLGLPDQHVADHVDELSAALDAYAIGADLVLTAHPGDGHTDHDATGRAVTDWSRERGVTAAAFGIWLWAWSLPGALQFAWNEASRVDLDADVCERKARAAAEFHSVFDAVRNTPAAIDRTVLEHYLRDVEVVFPLNGVLH